MKITILFTLALLALSQVEFGFNGIRITQLATDYLSDFVIFAEDGFKKTGGIPFSDIVSTSGDGTDKQILTMFNIKYSNFKYNKDEVMGTPVINSKRDFWALEVDSGVFEYIYTFDWKIQAFGLNLLFGNATLSMKSSKVLIEQQFVQGATKTQIHVTWKDTFLTFYSKNSKGESAKPWLSKVIVANISKPLEEKIQAEVPKEVDDDMITNYNKIHLNLQKGMEIDFVNTLHSMYKYSSGQGDYISLQYNTTVSIPNRPFNAEIVKQIYPKLAPDHQLEICFNEEIFAATMDTLGKGRYYYHIFTSEELTYSLIVANFLPIAPTLIASYMEWEPVQIGCRPDISERVVDLKVAGQNYYMQVPMKCAMSVCSTGEEFMSLTVEFRANYKPGAESSDGGIYALLENVKVHNFHSNYIPLQSLMELNEMLDKMAKYYNNMNVIFPSKITVPFHRPSRYQFKTIVADPTTDAICVKYDKFPSTKPSQSLRE